MTLYAKILYKIIDLNTKLRFSLRRLKYSFHPHITIGRNVQIEKNVTIKIIYGGSISLGENTKVMSGVQILSYGGNIKIGKNCSINPLTIIYGHCNTTIGHNVLIAGHTMLIPANHGFQDKNTLIINQKEVLKPIIIESNVWIAHSCSILGGSYIETGVIIAANSVVNKKLEKNKIYAGSPAKYLKSRF
jgi:acetyltransferase-like isoleucine patch superfamily enzyme